MQPGSGKPNPYTSASQTRSFGYGGIYFCYLAVAEHLRLNPLGHLSQSRPPFVTTFPPNSFATFCLKLQFLIGTLSDHHLSSFEPRIFSLRVIYFLLLIARQEEPTPGSHIAINWYLLVRVRPLVKKAEACEPYQNQ